LRRVAGRRDRVADLSSEELGRIDVGSWFNARHQTRARKEFAEEAVPTLKQAVDALADNGGLIYIELKCDRTSYKALTLAVCRILEDSPVLNRVILKSFHLNAVAEVHRLLPQVATAAFFKPSLRTILSHDRVIREATRVGAGVLSLHQGLVSTKLVGAAARHGLPITVWTVDDPRWLSRPVSRSVTALITNDPAAMIERLDSGNIDI
jgi:glycerophosphoryl diester phosphodiesterase